MGHTNRKSKTDTTALLRRIRRWLSTRLKRIAFGCVVTTTINRSACLDSEAASAFIITSNAYKKTVARRAGTGCYRFVLARRLSRRRHPDDVKIERWWSQSAVFPLQAHDPAGL
jgi:hypothetical protein